jgi:hypothetical protein
MTFHTTDMTSIEMEAHQNLGKPLDLACCRAVELALRNNDKYPRSITVHLWLRDTTRPDAPRVDLGQQPLQSRPVRAPYGEWVPVDETVRFEVPREERGGRFDQFDVLFERSAFRDHVSAKVAILKFVLAPAGRR